MIDAKSIFVSKETRKIFHPFTEEEISAHNAAIADNSVRCAVIEEQIKTLTAVLKEDRKPITKQLAADITSIRDGGIVIEVECFLVDDQDTGTMHYYDTDNNIVFSRPLTIHERQEHIPLHAVGENNE